MNITPLLSTLGNATVGFLYYHVAPRFFSLSQLGLSAQMKAFSVAALVQAIFNYRDETHIEEKTYKEHSIRILLPYVLIGGASFYSDRTAVKTNLLTTAILGTAQVVVDKMYASLINNKVNSSPFDSEAWKINFGDVGEAPPLPENIEEILNSPCPFNPDKKIKDTHMLTLIPATIDGDPFSLNKLKQLLENPKKINKSELSIANIYNEIGDKKIKKSYWILITKDNIASPIIRNEIIPQNIVVNPIFPQKKDNAVDMNQKEYEDYIFEEMLKEKSDNPIDQVNQDIDSDEDKYFKKHKSPIETLSELNYKIPIIDKPYKVPSSLELLTSISTHYIRKGSIWYVNKGSDKFSKTHRWCLENKGLLAVSIKYEKNKTNKKIYVININTNNHKSCVGIDNEDPIPVQEIDTEITGVIRL